MLTVEQIVFSLNQKGKVPAMAINAALTTHKIEIIPALLAVVKNVAENYQYIDLDDITYLTAMYLLAQLREPAACQDIIKIASLYRDWPEKLLGDVITEGLPRFIVSTYDGNLQNIKNLIEHTHANLYSRTSALHSLLGLFAINRLSREEIIDYYMYLLNSPLTTDVEFTEFLINDICSLYPQELYNDAIKFFDNGLINSGQWAIVHREDLQEALDMGMEDCLDKHVYDYKFHLPMENVIKEIAWLYRPSEEQKLINTSKVGRNCLCPCKSGKKYKKCCFNFQNSDTISF